jgi:hypothetical protein
MISDRRCMRVLADGSDDFDGPDRRPSAVPVFVQILAVELKAALGPDSDARGAYRQLARQPSVSCSFQMTLPDGL